MQRIQFGEAESLATVALRGGFGGKGAFIAPRFGTRCVCCNADAMGRTQDYDPSTDRVQASAVPMPVCFACKDHAFQSQTAGIFQACMLIVGVCAIGLGYSYLGDRPDDGFLKGMIAVGAVLTITGIVWVAAAMRRERRERAMPGHHARLSFSVAHGSTLLDTSNDELVVEVLQLNPRARLLPTPLLWRRRKEWHLPAARAVKVPPRADATDAEGERLAAYLEANPPERTSDERTSGGGREREGG